MTHAEKILQAVASVVRQKGKEVFTREEIRQQIGVSRDKWKASYAAIFQGMREDQPGGAPNLNQEVRRVFRQVEYSKHTLTEHGQELLKHL